jgi:hypothetical protein
MKCHRELVKLQCGCLKMLDAGTDVKILKYFRWKKLRKNDSNFDSNYLLLLRQKKIITLVLKKNANFLAGKSPTILSITLTPAFFSVTRTQGFGQGGFKAFAIWKANHLLKILKPGVDVMITIFGDFLAIFGGKNWRFSQKPLKIFA